MEQGLPLVVLVVLAIVVVAALIFCAIMMSLLNPWLQAATSGASVCFINLIGMWLRRTDPKVIVSNYIKAAKADLGVTTDQLEIHHLKGGNIANAVDGMVAAKAASIQLTWEDACQIDLAGDDVAKIIRGESK